MDRLFENKENRDKAWKEGGMRGMRGVVRNQQLHPMYVEDFEGPEKDQTGLGNGVYRTPFAVLYTLSS